MKRRCSLLLLLLMLVMVSGCSSKKQVNTQDNTEQPIEQTTEQKQEQSTEVEKTTEQTENSNEEDVNQLTISVRDRSFVIDIPEGMKFIRKGEDDETFYELKTGKTKIYVTGTNLIEKEATWLEDYIYISDKWNKVELSEQQSVNIFNKEVFYKTLKYQHNNKLYNKIYAVARVTDNLVLLVEAEDNSGSDIDFEVIQNLFLTR